MFSAVCQSALCVGFQGNRLQMELDWFDQRSKAFIFDCRDTGMTVRRWKYSSIETLEMHQKSLPIRVVLPTSHLKFLIWKRYAQK